jgi:membrane dipeptidase
MNIKNIFHIFSALVLLLLSGCSDAARDTIADAIHDCVLTVDSHVDTPLYMKFTGFDPGIRHDEPGSQVDFPRMKEGGLDAAFFAVFAVQGKLTLEGYEKARQTARETFDVIDASLAQYQDLAELALTTDDAYRIAGAGRRAIFIGMENGYPIGTDLSLIQEYYSRGARYITLCHLSNNDICDSSTDPDDSEDDGLSAFGRQVIAEMNRIGMMVDISHASDKTVLDVLEVSTAPIIASHSSSRAVYDHLRNLSDELIVKIAKKGGVVQATIEYVRDHNPDDPADLPTVAEFVDHIDHIVQVAGIDHAGIGTDFDGGGELADCHDVSQMQNITRELVKRSYTAAQIEKIWGGNLMRVLQEVQEAAELH